MLLGTNRIGKIEVIRCGIDLVVYGVDAARFGSPNANRRFRSLSVGRLSGIKGFRYLLDAHSW